MTIAPYPPTPLIIGSTTLRAAAAATAASKAFPPSARISRPAFVASGWAELTIPFVPTAGRVDVFLLAGPSTGLGAGSSARARSAGSVGSSVVRLPDAVVSSTDAASSAVLSSRGSFWAPDWTPQEHRAPTSNKARRILLKARLRETRRAIPHTPDCSDRSDVGIAALCSHRRGGARL